EAPQPTGRFSVLGSGSGSSPFKKVSGERGEARLCTGLEVDEGEARDPPRGEEVCVFGVVRRLRGFDTVTVARKSRRREFVRRANVGCEFNVEGVHKR